MRFALMLLLASGLSASPLLLTADGTFSSTTPTSSFTAASEPWSLSFQVDSNPAVLGSDAGIDFDTSFTNFAYTLNGSPVALTPANIQFYNANQFGGINVCFSPACTENSDPTNGLEIEGPQLYTGSETSPTIVPGTYDTSFLEAFVDTNAYEMDNSAITISAISSVPEPRTLFLMILAALGLVILHRRVRES